MSSRSPSRPRVGNGSRSRPDFAYGHTYRLRQLRGETVPLTDDEEATRDALQAELTGIEEAHEGSDDLPEEIDQRISEIETALETFEDRPITFDADEVSRAGAFVSIAPDGSLRIERGYVRPDDELPVEPEPEAAEGIRRGCPGYCGGGGA